MQGFLCFQMDSVLHILPVYGLKLAVIHCSEFASIILLSHDRHWSAEKVHVERLCKDGLISL